MRKKIAILFLGMAVAATVSLASPENNLAQFDALVKADHDAYLKVRNAVLNSNITQDELSKCLVKLDAEQRTYEADYSAYRAQLQARLGPQQAPQIVIAGDSTREAADARFEAAQKAKREAEDQAALAEPQSRVVGHQAAQEDAARLSAQWQTQRAIEDAKRQAEQAAKNAANSAWRGL